MDFNIEFHEQSSWNIGAEEFSTTNTIVDSDEFALVGEYDHSKLVNRNIADQHSISAITGLQESLDTKQPNGLCACLSTESYTVDWHRATAVFVAKPQFGLYDCCSLYGGQGGVMAYCGPANGSSQTVSTDKTIKRFWFMIYDKKPLISGSEIKIWGVRG